MLLDYCLYWTRLLSDWALLSDVDYWTCLTRLVPPLGAPLHPRYRHFSYYYYCVSYPFYCIGFCSLCTNDILLSHRLIHLVLFHPPAVFSGNRFTAGGRSYILLVCCACLFIDCMCCIFEENKLKPKLNWTVCRPSSSAVASEIVCTLRCSCRNITYHVQKNVSS